MLNLLLLLTAIIFEMCGDAQIRIGMRLAKPWSFVIGAVMVIAYGMIVSLPKWTFSRTMGVYIALFFIVSQIVARLMLKETVSAPVVLGGVFIVAGGLIILLWQPVAPTL